MCIKTTKMVKEEQRKESEVDTNGPQGPEGLRALSYKAFLIFVLLLYTSIALLLYICHPP